MSAFEEGGCRTPSYGNYNFGCSNCGVGAYRSTWNSMDPCLQASCCQTSPATDFTPDERCDYRERNSRNIYNWRKAFDYGSAMDFGKQGSGCIFMGSITDTNASFPWGYQGRYFKDFSGASYTGDLDKSRQDPYQVKSDFQDNKNSCGYDKDIRNPPQICDGMNAQCSGPLQKASQYAYMNIPFTPYEQL